VDFLEEVAELTQLQEAQQTGAAMEDVASLDAWWIPWR